MKKIILLAICIMFLSGCDATYKINYKNNAFDETLIINDYYVDEESTFLIDHYENDKIYSDINDKVLVDSNVTKKRNNLYKLRFESNYENQLYSDSIILSECFEFHKFEETDNYIYIALYGDYYCDEFDSIEIIFDTDKKVNFTNASKTFFGKYVWNYDKSDKIDIEIEINKKEANLKISLLIFVLSMVIITIILGVLVYKVVNRYKRNMEV